MTSNGVLSLKMRRTKIISEVILINKNLHHMLLGNYSIAKFAYYLQGIISPFTGQHTYHMQ